MKPLFLAKRYTGYGLLILSTLIVALTMAHYPREFDRVSSENPFLDRADYKTFYKALYAAGAKGDRERPTEAIYGYTAPVAAFVRRYGLERAHVLEVGAGSGNLQDIVADYTGLDISPESQRFFRKPFVEASATSIPFKAGEFDAIWTVNVLEHVPKPEQALSEMRRVIKDKGILYLQAAWQCRTWAAEGYDVRPYSDFGIEGQLIKASIPLRNSVVYRALYTFPIRLLRLTASLTTGKPTTYRYNALTPNYKTYWTSDSDAVNSMDPYEAILWFTSRGDEVLSYDGMIHPFFVSSGTIIIKINKTAK